MKWLHLTSLGCMSALTGAHTACCVQDPRVCLAHWIIAGGHLGLTAIQAITVALTMRGHKSADPPPHLS